jgi:predicted DsbA family dithiol-disulfide isomerase
VEVERLGEKYPLNVQFAPFLLDPTTPLEGKPRRGYTQPGDPPTPIEERGSELGLTYTRGRTWSSNSLLALEAGEFAREHESPEVAWAFHRAVFKAYFTDLADISKMDVLVEAARATGVDADAMRQALETRSYEHQVMDGLRWSREAGVTAVPTFIIDDQYGVVGAQPYEVLDKVLTRLGKVPKAG